MIAEESTAWPGVTKPVREGGLGFTFKWNMGWMHDTLAYFAVDPLYRAYHHDQLTFAMVYEYSERFIMPLSHDEVVHLKRSLLEKMPGDAWRRFANLRLLLAYLFTRPGKKLLFMGTELATPREWNHDQSLDWHLLDDPMRAAFFAYLETLGALYKAQSPLWRHDHAWTGFRWIDVGDKENSVVSYVRWDGAAHVVTVLNFTPVPRQRYRVGVPSGGVYTLALSTDDERWGGSGFDAATDVVAEAVPFHGHQWSVELSLPPLGALVFVKEAGAAAAEAPATPDADFVPELVPTVPPPALPDVPTIPSLPSVASLPALPDAPDLPDPSSLPSVHESSAAPPRRER
jgi:1,4-alpha-glucan branching enzyme